MRLIESLNDEDEILARWRVVEGIHEPHLQAISASGKTVLDGTHLVYAAMEPTDKPLVLGFDAVGSVVATGPDVSTLEVGDEVWYAGDFTRDGANAERHAVDERIVAERPGTLSAAEAAALPLTAITAWESLFDRLRLCCEAGRYICGIACR